MTWLIEEVNDGGLSDGRLALVANAGADLSGFAPAAGAGQVLIRHRQRRCRCWSYFGTGCRCRW